MSLRDIDLFSWDEMAKVWLSAHRVEFLLLFGIAVALALIVIIALILYLTKPKRRAEELPDIPPRSGPDYGKWVKLAFIVVLIGLAAGAGAMTSATSRSSFCLACHQGELAPGWADFSHRRVACRSCHLPDFETYVKGELVLGAKLISRYTPYKLKVRWPRTDIACDVCHKTINKGVMDKNGSELSHREIMERGLECFDCHAEIHP